MDAEKSAIFDEMLDLNKRTIALGERIETYVLGSRSFHPFSEPVTAAIAEMARHIVLCPDKEGNQDG